MGLKKEASRQPAGVSGIPCTPHLLPSQGQAPRNGKDRYPVQGRRVRGSGRRMALGMFTEVLVQALYYLVGVFSRSLCFLVVG